MRACNVSLRLPTVVDKTLSLVDNDGLPARIPWKTKVSMVFAYKERRARAPDVAAPKRCADSGQWLATSAARPNCWLGSSKPSRRRNKV